MGRRQGATEEPFAVAVDLFWQFQLATAEVEAVGGRTGGGEDVGVESIDDKAVHY
jgi:hypothetical protein